MKTLIDAFLCGFFTLVALMVIVWKSKDPEALAALAVVFVCALGAGWRAARLFGVGEPEP